MKKILIVDDEPIMLKLASRALQGQYEITTANSGAEGLEKFPGFDPDMVISDVKMPGMSGYEFQEHIRRDHGSTVPFVFMTADESEGSEERGLQSGAAAYIRKPFRVDVMQESVKRVFESCDGTGAEGAAGNDAAADPAGKAAATGAQPGGGEDPIAAEKAKLPEWLRHEPLIEIDRGIQHSETAEDYLTFLNIFLEHVEDNVNVLERSFEERDIENYTIKAHGLKSTSRIIGAMILSSMAFAMERAGLENNLRYIIREHANFIETYRKYEKALKSHVSEVKKEELPEEDLQDAMMALREYSDAEDYSLVESTIAMLQKYKLPDRTQKLVFAIKLDLGRLDWDAIHEKMRQG